MKQQRNTSTKLKPQTIRNRLSYVRKKDRISDYNHKDTCEVGKICIVLYRKAYGQDPHKTKEGRFEVNIYPVEFIRHVDAVIYKYFEKKQQILGTEEKSTSGRSDNDGDDKKKKRKRIKKGQPLFSTQGK